MQTRTRQIQRNGQVGPPKIQNVRIPDLPFCTEPNKLLAKILKRNKKKTKKKYLRQKG